MIKIEAYNPRNIKQIKCHTLSVQSVCFKHLAESNKTKNPYPSRFASHKVSTDTVAKWDNFTGSIPAFVRVYIVAIRNHLIVYILYVTSRQNDNQSDLGCCCLCVCACNVYARRSTFLCVLPLLFCFIRPFF